MIQAGEFHVHSSCTSAPTVSHITLSVGKEKEWDFYFQNRRNCSSHFTTLLSFVKWIYLTHLKCYKFLVHLKPVLTVAVIIRPSYLCTYCLSYRLFFYPVFCLCVYSVTWPQSVSASVVHRCMQYTHKLASDDTNGVFSQEDMDLLTSWENGLDGNQIKWR